MQMPCTMYEERDSPAGARVQEPIGTWPPRLPSPSDGSREEPMNGKSIGTALVALIAATALVAPALAQNEQFIPQLVYRTGAYAPNGIPVANGIADYYTLINERDGGINGVKIVFEECDTGYATDRGVECYERPKRKGPTGAAYAAAGVVGGLAVGTLVGAANASGR